MTRLIATFFYFGLMPVAPGTVGSLAALPVGLLILGVFGPIALALGVCIVFGVGWWATAVETAGATDHDPSEIVIDEVAGQWIALLALPPLTALAPASLGLWMLAAFALFRLFDILKPPPVSWADRMETPFGVMFDDVLAGIMAALVLIVARLVLT